MWTGARRTRCGSPLGATPTPSGVTNCLPWLAAQIETIRANVIGCLNLADVCMLREIHMTYFGTGCIFHYDESHPIGGEGFKESDTPNFTGSYYSHTKVRHAPCMMGCSGTGSPRGSLVSPAAMCLSVWPCVCA